MEHGLIITLIHGD